MEEININLDSVPHNNVNVDLNSMGSSTGDINVMSDSSSIGLDLLVNKKKVGGGDSGGPSFATFGGEVRVIGVTSHAYDTSDCFETGGVDTRTDAYLDWIESNMTAYCDNGIRTWCEVSGIINPSLRGCINLNQIYKVSFIYGCTRLAFTTGLR